MRAGKERSRPNFIARGLVRFCADNRILNIFRQFVSSRFAYIWCLQPNILIILLKNSLFRKKLVRFADDNRVLNILNRLKILCRKRLVRFGPDDRILNTLSMLTVCAVNLTLYSCGAGVFALYLKLL